MYFPFLNHSKALGCLSVHLLFWFQADIPQHVGNVSGWSARNISNMLTGVQKANILIQTPQGLTTQYSDMVKS